MRQTFLTSICLCVASFTKELSHNSPKSINHTQYSIFLLTPLCHPDSKPSHQKNIVEGSKAFWQIHNLIKHMISTVPGLLDKPDPSGYIFNSNIHFSTFSVTIILGVGSRHVITQGVYMSSIGAGKLGSLGILF